MDTVKISRITEIVGAREVNNYLSIGWELLCSAPGQHQEDREAYILYSLGWPSGKGDVQWPKGKEPYWN